MALDTVSVNVAIITLIPIFMFLNFFVIPHAEYNRSKVTIFPITTNPAKSIFLFHWSASSYEKRRISGEKALEPESLVKIVIFVVMKTRVLFVCLGNICRSPAAEAVLRSLAEKSGVGVSCRLILPEHMVVMPAIA